MFYNRDLSWLGFNLRVLQEAVDKDVPLYERIKFLSIFSSNLDEFFRVRYPSVFAFSKMNRKTKMKVSVSLDEDVPDKIQTEINRQLNIFGQVLNEEILPGLKANGINFYYNTPIREEHAAEIRELFLSKILSFIQPLYLESNIGREFIPENNQLYLVVVLKESELASLKHAVLNIPSDKLPRFTVLTPLDDEEYVIFIDDIIRENLDCLFPGFEIMGTYSVKFNRDSELHLDEDYTGNLLTKMFLIKFKQR